MSMPSNCRVISSTRDAVGECPVWSVVEQALYWVDIDGRLLHRWDWATQQQRSWPTPERIGCFALTAQGVVVAAMESGIFALTLGAAPQLTAQRLVSITHPVPDMRFNDGRCDRQGRFWVSTMCMDRNPPKTVGAVYCFDGQTLSAPQVERLITPNGMAFSLDGCTMFLSDSDPSVQTIWNFDFDATAGALSNRRVFVDMRALPGRPDGAAVDSEDHYWICGNDAGLVHRFSPAGVLVQSFAVPAPKPAMCAFGGPNLDVLFVTSIMPASSDPAFVQDSGAVFALQVGVCGVAEPLFQGPLGAAGNLV